MNLHEYQAAFRQKHPEAADVRAGAHVSSEELQRFADVIGGKIVELRQKPELTKDETAFIDRTMDLGVRSVIYVHERFGIPIPESENTVAVAMGIGELQGTPPAPQQIVLGLHSITGTAYSMRTNPEQRSQLEDIGFGSMHMLAEMSVTTDGMSFDSYLEGNLQNIIAHFEKVEDQQH